jgi:hypothetical protein
MKKLIISIFVIVFLLASAVSSFTIVQLTLTNGDAEGMLELNSGRNYITINSSEFVSAKDFLLKNTNIEMISYTEGNKTIGYVNVLGGIGKNFMLEDGKIYEIYFKKENNGNKENIRGENG